jgi:hypothetical protein
MQQDNSAASAGRRVPRKTTRRFRRKRSTPARTVEAHSPARQEVRIVVEARILPAARSVRTVPAPPASPPIRAVLASVEVARSILRAERERDRPLLDSLEAGFARPARRQRTSTPPPDPPRTDPAADSLRLDAQGRWAQQELRAEGFHRLLDIHSEALLTSHARISSLEEASRLHGFPPPPLPPAPSDSATRGSNVLEPSLQEQLAAKSSEAAALRARLDRALQARAAAAPPRPPAAEPSPGPPLLSAAPPPPRPTSRSVLPRPNPPPYQELYGPASRTVLPRQNPPSYQELYPGRNVFQSLPPSQRRGIDWRQPGLLALPRPGQSPSSRSPPGAHGLPPPWATHP